MTNSNAPSTNIKNIPDNWDDHVTYITDDDWSSLLTRCNLLTNNKNIIEVCNSKFHMFKYLEDKRFAILKNNVVPAKGYIGNLPKNHPAYSKGESEK